MQRLQTTGKCWQKRKGLDLESLEICFKEPACCVPWLLSNALAVVKAGAELNVRFGFLGNIICLTVLMSRRIETVMMIAFDERWMEAPISPLRIPISVMNPSRRLFPDQL